MEPLLNFIALSDIDQKVEQWVQQEQQDPRKVESIAKALFLNLPNPVKLALLNEIEGVPDQQIYAWITQELLRVINHQQFESASRQIAETMDTSNLGSLETEDDILNGAVRLTNRPL